MSNALDIANACIPSAESELPIMPHARAILIGVARDRIQAALAEERRKAIVDAAQIAENFKGGFTASFDADILIPDKDGPWGLNTVIAKAIRALLSESKS